MQMHWQALLIGAAIGAGLGWWMGSRKAVGGNVAGITGAPAAPFQAKIHSA